MTGISTLGQAMGRIKLLNNQNTLLNSLTTQLASGKKTQSFEGLKGDLLISKRARADFKSLEVYTNNITIADRRIKQMLLSIDEFKAQAENFANSLVQLSEESTHQQGEPIFYDDPLTPEVENIPVGYTSAKPDIDFKSMQDLATNIFNFMGDLLNAKDGDRYLFSGADSLTKPYSNNGTLDAAVSTLIANWKDETLPPGTQISTTQLISAIKSTSTSQSPNAITDTIVGYSASLSAGNVGNIHVRVDEKSEIKYTALANEQPFRDIMVVASFIKNQSFGPIADVYAEPYTAGDPTLANGAPGATTDEMKENFFSVFKEMAAMVNAAIDDMDSVSYRLENTRAQMDKIKTAHINDKSVLVNTIDDVENVNMNDVAVRINSLQVQLEASYRVTASLQQYSLVNFI